MGRSRHLLCWSWAGLGTGWDLNSLGIGSAVLGLRLGCAGHLLCWEWAWRAMISSAHGLVCSGLGCARLGKVLDCPRLV
jgi:hypothetical protein